MSFTRRYHRCPSEKILKIGEKKSKFSSFSFRMNRNSSEIVDVRRKVYRCARSISVEVSSGQTLVARKNARPGDDSKFFVSSGPICHDNDHPDREGENER